MIWGVIAWRTQCDSPEPRKSPLQGTRAGDTRTCGQELEWEACCLALNPNSATHRLPKLNNTEPIDHQMFPRPLPIQGLILVVPCSLQSQEANTSILCSVSSVEQQITEKSSRQGAASRRQVPQDRFEKTLTLKRSSWGSVGQHLFICSGHQAAKGDGSQPSAILFVKTQNWVYKFPWNGSAAAGAGGLVSEGNDPPGSTVPSPWLLTSFPRTNVSHFISLLRVCSWFPVLLLRTSGGS